MTTDFTNLLRPEPLSLFQILGERVASLCTQTVTTEVPDDELTTLDHGIHILSPRPAEQYVRVLYAPRLLAALKDQVEQILRDVGSPAVVQG